MECSDGKLLARMREDDRRAFAIIYDRYAAGLLGFTARKVASLEEASDLVHDLFVEIWNKRGQLQIQTSFRTYVFGAIRYKIIDHIRKNSRQDYYIDLLSSLQARADDSTRDSILFRDLMKLTESEIDKLPPRTREIFLLSRQQHLSVGEIAGKLKLSDQTVKNQLSTALRKLRPRIEYLVKNFIFL